MILMMIDHASMAIDRGHFSADSAVLYTAETQVQAADFMTRWITHLCAPTFVFLAGTALAVSIKRREARGADGAAIDRSILTRGLFIALLDPTLVSLFSWRLTFQVLYAIGLSMMCMALLRRLPARILLAARAAWLIFGELLVRVLWDPSAGNPSIPVALTMGFYYEPFFRISYPLLPWLALMCMGWAFGDYLSEQDGPKNRRLSPAALLTVSGLIGLAVYTGVRWLNGCDNMFLTPEIRSWMDFLLVSKYPPSLSFMALQLGLLGLILAGMIKLEQRFGVRPNGVLLVFGQTAMFFYLLHRIVLEGLAQWCGLRGAGGLGATYAVSAVFLLILYPLCRRYCSYKREHPGGWTRFI